MAETTVIAVLGAPGSGKSTLAAALQQALSAEGRRVALVGALLQEFRAAEGRSPGPHELVELAAQQTRRIEAAAAGHDIVIADTTALQLAAYGDLMFAEHGQYGAALRDQARCRHTLLCALDLPCLAGTSPGEGQHMRVSMDALLRAALQHHAPGYSVVGGTGPARLAAALAVLQPAPEPDPTPLAGRWHWVCERCGDADCERHLLPRG